MKLVGLTGRKREGLWSPSAEGQNSIRPTQPGSWCSAERGRPAGPKAAGSPSPPSGIRSQRPSRSLVW